MTVTTITKAAGETHATLTTTPSVPMTPTAKAPTATPPAVKAPSVHRRAFLTWLAVYPSITAAFLLLGPHLAHLPVPVRTLVMTLVVVPVVTYLVMPRLMKAEARIARHEAARRARGAHRG